jgi:hypothetical protein
MTVVERIKGDIALFRSELERLVPSAPYSVRVEFECVAIRSRIEQSERIVAMLSGGALPVGRSYMSDHLSSAIRAADEAVTA